MLLSNQRFSNWREIQAHYTDYKASLEFETIEEVMDYIAFDYKVSKSFIHQQAESLFNLDLNQIEINI